MAESIVVTALPALIAVAFGSERVAFLIEAVPVAAPIFKVVAPSAKLTVVAVLSIKLKVDADVVSEPPLTATFPAVVILPFDPVIE